VVSGFDLHPIVFDEPHSIETPTVNVHDIAKASSLIREDDGVVYGDAGYLGIEKREEIAGDERLSSIDYRINRRVGSLQKAPVGTIHWGKEIKRRKSSVRARVEPPFLIVKRLLRYSKTFYEGLAKNTHQLHVLFASAKLLMCARAGRPLPA
jgi:IS5 family transposase